MPTIGRTTLFVEQALLLRLEPFFTIAPIFASPVYTTLSLAKICFVAKP
jgi:hypothetical protein